VVEGAPKIVHESSPLVGHFFVLGLRRLPKGIHVTLAINASGILEVMQIASVEKEICPHDVWHRCGGKVIQVGMAASTNSSKLMTADPSSSHRPVLPPHGNPSEACRPHVPVDRGILLHETPTEAEKLYI
jgi:hypothetical protein